MSARSFSCCLILALTSLLAACAPAVSPNAADGERMARLEQSQADLDRRLQHLQDNLVLLEAKMNDQQQTLEELRRGQTAGKGTPAGQITAPAPAPTPAQAPQPTPPRQQPAATDLYLQAFADYAAGRYQQAVDGFARFLQSYAASDYAGNAQYWLAECYLAMKQYGQAAAAFEQTADRFPDNAKAPDALLKLAETQRRLGDAERAADTERLLRSRYPQSAAARKSLSTP